MPVRASKAFARQGKNQGRITGTMIENPDRRTDREEGEETGVCSSRDGAGGEVRPARPSASGGSDDDVARDHRSDVVMSDPGGERRGPREEDEKERGAKRGQFNVLGTENNNEPWNSRNREQPRRIGNR